MNMPLHYAVVRRWLSCGLVPTLLSLTLLSCGNDQRSADQVSIRLRNDTPYAIDNLWLGAGPESGADNTEFGAIAQGENTAYHGIEPVLANYRKLNFVANHTRYLAAVDLLGQVGSAELAPGSYTFVCTIVNDAAVITVITESD